MAAASDDKEDFMSKKSPPKDNGKTTHHGKGGKSEISFKKMSSTELAEFTARRAAGESESAIAADFKRRKRA